MSGSIKITFDDVFEAFCEESFGPNGTVSKSYASEEGDALFAAFLAELEKIPPENSHKKMLLERARERRYHDYEGDLMKIGLVIDLKAAGLASLAGRVMKGEFDF